MSRERFSRGSLKKSTGKPQKWLGDWYVYVPVPGERDKRVHRGPKIIGLVNELSKSEAQRKLDELIAVERSTSDQSPRDSEKDVNWMFRRFAELKSGSWKQASKDSFMWLWQKQIAPYVLRSEGNRNVMLGDAPLLSVTRADCQIFLNKLAEAGKSKSLVKNCRMYLKAVFDEALEEGLLLKNPARKLDIPRCKPSCERVHTVDEIERLLAASSGRDHLIIRLSVVCGFRPGELFALRRRDVEAGRIRVDENIWRGKVQDGAKTDSSEACVSVPAGLEAEIRMYLESHVGEDQDALLFPNDDGGPMREENYLRRTLKEIAADAGVEGVNFQSLRRTTATLGQLVGSVKDVQGMLRHSDAGTTLRAYMKTIPESQRAAVEALDSMVVREVIQ